jgi:group II intron reverse transcriptase/maturase
MGTEDLIDDISRSTQSCEVTQLQKIVKEAKVLLAPFKNRINKGSKVVQKSFTEENLAKVMISYYDVVTNAEKSENYDQLYNILVEPCYLLLAYSRLKKDASAGLDEIDGTNMTLSGLRTLSKELISEKYKCAPVRRVYIDKPDGGKRPLGISSLKDKVVQKGILMLLEPRFEKQFRDCSHGFRPKKSCHTALKSLYSKGNGTRWFIELDLVKAFDRIHHGLLIDEVRKEVKEQRMLDLIYKMLKVGYIDPHNLADSKLELSEGTPQGSILSPMFANIMFHKLDVWVEENLLPIYNQARIDKVLSVGLSYGRPKYNQAVQEGIRDYDPYYRKLWYVRYADDMLLGLIGPKSEALLILDKIKEAVESELKMEIHPTKSGVEHHSDGVLFLGYKLFGRYSAKFNLHDTKNGSYAQRLFSNRIKFSIPTKQLIKHYADKGFFQVAKKGKNPKYVGRRVDKWISLVGDEYVIRRYNSIMRGIANYYSGNEYPSALYGLFYLLKRSAALTLAHRHKLKSAKKAFQRWGKDLSVPIKSKPGQVVSFEMPTVKYGLKKPSAKEGNLYWLRNVTSSSGHALVHRTNSKTLNAIVSVTELACCIPSCPNMANEWYHVNSQKRSKAKSFKQQYDVANRSRQIPVCSAHHAQITSGKYDGPSLRKIPGYDAENIDKGENGN